MTFRKFRADGIFTGTELLGPDTVVICDSDGTILEVTNAQSAGDDIQQLKGVLSPGFINCHCHLELSHMKGLIPEKTGLVDFVFSVVTQRHFNEEEILQAIAEAEADMIRNGIVAVGDICNNTLTLHQKKQQDLHYYNFVETSGWLPEVALQRFERSSVNFELFSEVSPTSIVPHAPYSVSEQLWQLIEPFYRNRVVSIHNQETAFEDELFLQNSGDFLRMYKMMKLDTSFYQPSGKSSLQTYFDKLCGAATVLLVHNTFTSETDLQFVQKQRSKNGVFFCICANANKYIEDAIPRVNLLRDHDCNIVIGTDSLASNWSLSVLDEMKTIHKNYPEVGLQELDRKSVV